MPIVKEECEKAGIKWNKPVNFLASRLPDIFAYYLWAPLRRRGEILDAKRSCITEALDPRNVFPAIMMVLEGFVGAGGV